MKKAGKGLIISSIAMVLVVAVSLVTSTFAWFSADAKATVSDLNVQTAAAKGIQIATMKADGTSFFNGAATLDATYGTYKGANAGFGQNLDFSFSKPSTENVTPLGYFGVSGMGINGEMYKAVQAEIDAAGTPGTMVDAVANTDYFESYIALRNIDDSAKVIGIKSLTITGAFASAASMRIAFFATDAVASIANLNTTAGVALAINPYANLAYDPEMEDWGITNAVENGYLTKLGEVEEEDFTDDMSYEDGFAKTAKLSDAESFGSKYIAGTGMTVTTGTNETSELSQYKLENKALFATSIASGKALYVRMVIWFEGEDNECIQLFSGLNAPIAIEFGFIS